ncbi:MAG: DUF4221 domain-containing protein [Bacteroidales bacterium]|nr:DUF4221 domain-containing protein [Bacteroidales bacterium]
MKFFSLTVVLCCVLNFCANAVVNKERDKYPNGCSLTLKKIKEFPLDDKTSYMVESLQFTDHDTIQYLSFLNEHNNAVYFYDHESRLYLKHIPYHREGPDGVGGIDGYYYINNDSIYLYSYGTQLLYLTNAEGSVLSKNKIEQYDNPDIIYPAAKIMNNAPLRKVNRNIIMTGFIAGEPERETTENRPVGIIYNSDTDSVKYVINYPEQYAKYNWGGGFTYRQVSYDINGQSMAVSFYAHHYIVEYSLLTGEIKQHYAGSRLIDEIKPLPYPKYPTLPRIDVEVGANWYMSSPSYEGVFYDKYKNRYYRIARLPTEIEYELGDRNRKPTVVIVLDADFNYLGEATLPKDVVFNPFCSFVSSDGFNIQVITDNEDLLTFHCYNFFADEE